MKSKLRMLVGMCCAMSLVITGLSAAGSGASVKAAKAGRGGTLTWAYGCNPTRFDPAAVVPINTACGVEMAQVYDLLLYENPVTFEIKYGIAKSLTSPDATVWTMKLEKGVEFTDGTPLDATAVKFNLDRHADPNTRSTQAAATTNIASTEAVDATTVKITLKTPQASFPRQVARNLSLIASPAAIQAHGANYGTSPDTTVGAGPFVLSAWARDSSMTFDRNPDYWDAPRPYLDKMTFLVIADIQARYNAVRSGQAAGIVLTTSDLRASAEADGLEVIADPPTGQPDIRLLNTTRPPFNNPEVRKALNMAIDPEIVSQGFYQGQTQTVKPYTLFPKSSPFHNPKLKFPTFNKAEAQKLFNKVASETGAPVEFTHSGGSQTCIYGQVIQTALSGYENVKMNLACLLAGDYAAQVGRGSFDYALWTCPGAQLVADPDPGLYNCLHTGQSQNITGYSNPEMDAALEKGRSSTDLKERKEAYDTVQKLIIRDLPFVVLPVVPTGTTFIGHEKSVRGIEDNRMPTIANFAYVRLSNA
jgi:peptide/nickel transport system substrate-binding protein